MVALLLKLLALGAAVCADAADGFKNTTGADELRTFVGGATIFAIEWTDGVPTGWAFAGGDNTSTSGDTFGDNVRWDAIERHLGLPHPLLAGDAGDAVRGGQPRGAALADVSKPVAPLEACVLAH